VIVPRATYRIQLNSAFTFVDATGLVPYLSALGISHVYCSPYFRARSGSTHGYDVVDHNDFNPEIGTRAQFETFVATLRAHDMGHILDIVPNHVGVMGADNQWWMDVLQYGRASRYAEYFDIEWDPADPDLAGKLLVPVLGAPYGEVLERGDLQLRFEAAADTFAVYYHEHRFPIAPADYSRARQLLEQGATPGADALHELLERQAYRLAYWRVASDEINYRRFFDINDLAALRMENPEVFEATHRLILELLRDGKLDGLRIDHPDGLYDPAQYFQRLQQLGTAAGGGNEPRNLYVLVEKILAHFEKLPRDWPVSGTSGYVFANKVQGLCVDANARGRMDRIYRAFLGEPIDWTETVRQSKRQILRDALSAELNVLANQLTRIARADRDTRDFTLNRLRDALIELIACFPVYRTYMAGGVSDDDRRYLAQAIAAAKRCAPLIGDSTFDFVHATLLDARARPFAMRFQQVTAPVTAKGTEDTALYRFNRLSSLNDVGGEPDVFGTTVRGFHADNRARAKFWPHEMLASSTHDSKRSEDVRARISVLSQMPAQWRAMLVRWRRMNRERKRDVGGRPAPGPNQEFLLYQTLLGTWPADDPDLTGRESYIHRIQAYMVKAAREAKMRTSWADHSPEYEQALGEFIADILRPAPDNAFPADLATEARQFARLGYLNSLTQTVCKLTAPGVPDIYQGNEFWDYSLVDPDNRRAVDYAARRECLAQLIRSCSDAGARAGCARRACDAPHDGVAKLLLTWTVLNHRRAHAVLFRDGSYTALRVAGTQAAHVCAFARRHGTGVALTIAPRLHGSLLAPGDSLRIPTEVWDDTVVELPRRCRPRDWINVLDGCGVVAVDQGDNRVIRVADVLGNFPVALLATNYL
jgi:(1->4)-alpha-D-glucan 1-alpha-D-glucosylmutase